MHSVERARVVIETTVESIRVSLVTQSRVVILKEVDGERHLPIWIGTYEAEAIGMALQGTIPTRPLPYDLFKSLVSELGATVERIEIADLNEQIYFAKVVLGLESRTIEIDARPSDAIAIALRTGASIMVAEGIMNDVAVSMDTDDDDDDITLRSAAATPSATGAVESTGSREPVDAAEEERLSVFRDFINSLDLDDFDKKKKSG